MDILPKKNFGYAQCRDKFLSRNGRSKTEKMTRICMACALDTRFYRHLQPVKWLGVLQYHCHTCGHIGPEGRCCKRVMMPYPDMPILELPMLVCYRRPRFEDVTPLSPFESFSEEIMRNIVQFLEYKDAINLSMTSHHMYDFVKPTGMVPIHERYLLVNEKFTGLIPVPWRRPPLIYNYFARPKLPCFVCFRLRDNKHFSTRQKKLAQHNPRGYWRLRCHSCIHKMFVEGDHRTLVQYKSYRMCQDCWCLAIVDKKCENCAEWEATGKSWRHGPPYQALPVAPLPYASDTELFEALIGSPPDPRHDFSFLTPETFPLRKKPVLRDRDFR